MGLDSPLGTKSILLIPDNQRICFLADVLFESRAEKVRKGLGTKDPLVVVPHRLDLQLAFAPLRDPHVPFESCRPDAVQCKNRHFRYESHSSDTDG